MATKQEPTQQQYQELTRRWRGVCALVAVLLAVVSGWYLLWPRQVRTAAPQCGSESLDCTVTVSAPIDGVVLASLLLFTVLFTLMAMTGIALMPTPDGTSFTPVQKAVAQVAAIPENATRIVTASVRDLDVPEGAETTAVPRRLPVAAPLVLWNTIPTEDQQTVLDFARETLQLEPSQVRHGITELAVDGDGPQAPYYVRLRVGGRDSVLRLS